MPCDGVATGATFRRRRRALPEARASGAGDTHVELTIQSISKPFTDALALADRGFDAVLAKVGVEPSGEAFDEPSPADTRQRSLLVTTRDLAVMAATLANRGVHPRSGDRVVLQAVVRQVLSVMSTCGMDDAAGDWATRVGILGAAPPHMVVVASAIDDDVARSGGLLAVALLPVHDRWGGRRRP